VGVSTHLSRFAGGGLEISEGTAKREYSWNAYEDPYDSVAVEFGYYLYGQYGSRGIALTVDLLIAELESWLPLFQAPPLNRVPSYPLRNPNTYPLDRFDCTLQNDCQP
jgi:hypothetical protein